MSFPRYERYKDSGVDWLGEVPEHWQVCPVGTIAKIVNGYPFDSEQFSTTEGYPLVRIRDLNQAVTDTRYNGTFVESAAITSDDVLIGMDGDFNVGRWLGKGKALLNQRMCCVRAYSDSLMRLLEHALPIPLQAINDLTYATTVKHLSSSQIEKTRIALPEDVDEQVGLLSFLDNETAKIDGLIEEQRRLIELLKEKRQAVISHAVTKGLNPDAPMKESGIDWLGTIPSRWIPMTVTRIIVHIEQGWSPDCFTRPADVDEWGVVKSGCVNRGTFVETENKALPIELDPNPDYEIKSGDVLMSRASGSPELVGSTALVTQTRPQLMLSDKIFRIQLEPTISKVFFVVLFNSRIMRSQIERAVSGAGGLANNLPQSALKSFWFALPPSHEQEEIAIFTTEQVEQIDALLREAERATQLLQERRSALISAAVTGKIDVRTYTPKEAA